ncbi:aryl-sulfate sulfotransferase [bacterium]|nr:aryl-sulfate sulfotransferase [bacterium]
MRYLHLRTLIFLIFLSTLSISLHASFNAIYFKEEQSGSDPSVFTEEKGNSDSRAFTVFGEPAILANGVSVPSDFPYSNVLTNENPASGRIVLSYRDSNAPYILILNNDGTPFWYQKLDAILRQFTKQPTGLLTALTTYNHPVFGTIPHSYIGMDNTYTVVDTFYAGPNAYVDEHELRVLPNGHYLIIAEEKLFGVDMRTIVQGGDPDANIDLTNLRELNERDSVVWEWRSLNHFEYTDIDPALWHLTDSFIDFPHINSIDIDEDGHLVISSRHLSEVTKINRETKEIIWRLGGLRSDFVFIDDPFDGFSAQHDARCLGNGHYSIFDNGNGRWPQESRGVEYVLDTQAMTATLVWEYRSQPGRYSGQFGNVQQLPNGNKLINWGSDRHPNVTEVRPDGTIAYEMKFEDREKCYRVHRESWDAPAVKPYLIVESGTAGITLIFNQFGDGQVDYYNIYHGLNPAPSAVLDTSRLTMKTLTDLENKEEHYFRITSVNQSGEESDFSNEAYVLVKLIKPGGNQVLNPDFADQDEYWEFGVNGEVTASGSVENEVYHVRIQENAGSSWLVYLGQMPMELKQKKSYIMQFDAWASKTMRIQPAVINNNSGSDYSKIGKIQITQERKSYSYEFISGSANSEAVLAFIITDQPGCDVYFDHVSFKQQVASAVYFTADDLPLDFQLSQNYPNPFNDQTVMTLNVPVECRICMTLYDVLGRQTGTVRKGNYLPGDHQLSFQNPSLSSGIYFFHVAAETANGRQLYHQIVKMIYLK